MAVEVEYVTGEIVVAVHDDVALVVAVLLIPESQVFAFELFQVLEEGFRRRLAFSSVVVIFQLTVDGFLEGELVSVGVHVHIGKVDMRVGGGVDVRFQVGEDVEYVVDFAFENGGVDIEQRLPERGEGVEIADSGVGLQCPHFVEGLCVGGLVVGLVGLVRPIKQSFVVLVELFFSSAELFGVVALYGVPCHLGAPEESMPAVVEQCLAVVVPAGIHKTFGAVEEAVAGEVGDVLHVAVGVRTHGAMMTERRSYPEGVALLAERFYQVVV